MGKANAASRKKADLDGIEANFDKIADDLTKTALYVKKVMPLVTTSLLLTVELVKTYKDAFKSVRK